MEPNIDRSMWGVIVLIIAVVVGVLAKDKIYAAVDGIFNKMDSAIGGVNLEGLGVTNNGGGSGSGTEGEGGEENPTSMTITIPEAKLIQIAESHYSKNTTNETDREIINETIVTLIKVGDKTWSGSGDLTVDIPMDDYQNNVLNYEYDYKEVETTRDYLLNNNRNIAIQTKHYNGWTSNEIIYGSGEIDADDSLNIFMSTPWVINDQSPDFNWDEDEIASQSGQIFYDKTSASINIYKSNVRVDFYFNNVLLTTKTLNNGTHSFDLPRPAVFGDVIKFRVYYEGSEVSGDSGYTVAYDITELSYYQVGGNRIEGKSTPNAVVTFDYDRLPASVTADANGNWVAHLDTPTGFDETSVEGIGGTLVGTTTIN